MNIWVKIFESKGFQVCAEKGSTENMPSITLRIHKDNGELRTQMVIPPDDKSRESYQLAMKGRDMMFEGLEQDAIDSAVDMLLEMEEDLKDGKQRAFAHPVH